MLFSYQYNATKVKFFLLGNYINMGAQNPSPMDMEIGRIFMKLPLDIQIPILKFLPKESLQILLTEVPKLYDTLVLDKSLWETIELNGMAIRTSRACKLLTKAPYYTRVIIANRKDLTKLLRILCKSPRRDCITSLSFVNCEGSVSIRKPFVRDSLVLQLVKTCPQLTSFELRDNKLKSIMLYQYLGRNCLNFQFLYLTPNKSELGNFFKHAPVSSLVLMDDESVSGNELMLHVISSFVYGTFMVTVVGDKYKVSFSLPSQIFQREQ